MSETMPITESGRQPARRYGNVIAAFLHKPWAILPQKLAQIQEVVVLRASGERFSEEEIMERLGARQARNAQPTTGAVAVIPIYGTIMPRADIFSEMSGGTSMDRFIAAINQAANDTNVSSILLDVDSPGGQVDMVPEAAAAIRAARAKKPVTAVANTMAASAAYWLASQASELVITPSGEVGSVGVFAAHQDISEMQAMMGVKTTLISAGKHKTELSPFAPLSEDALAATQAQIDEYYTMFTRDISAGRKVGIAAVRSGFGEGRMVLAQAAVKEGMADRVDTFDNTLARMMSGKSVQTPTALSGNDGVVVAVTNFVGQGVSMSDSATAGTTTGITANVPEWWTLDDTPAGDEDDDKAKSESAPHEPQMSLAELRRESRQAAVGEREQYLSLLRRLNK